jgi:dCMP deaminase
MLLAIQSKPMNKWDSRFCELARFVADWSKDPNAKVGAVLYAKRGGDITVGYNGFPIGVEDSVERLTDVDTKLELIVHAEQNAVIAAGSRAEGATVYVWGKPICARCAGMLIQAGIAWVVAPSPDSVSSGSKWHLTGVYGRQILEEAGVQVNLFTIESAD